MKKIILHLISVFLLFHVSLFAEEPPEDNSGSLEAIKNLKFIWLDGQPAQTSGSGGIAILKTIEILDNHDNVVRSIHAKQEAGGSRGFIQPDGYEYIENEQISNPNLWTTNKKGVYNASGAATKNRADTNSTTWKDLATAAFKDPNLNHIIGGDRPTGGNSTVEKIEDINISEDSPFTRHKLIYDHGVKIGFAGDGYVIVSERGGNNSYVLQALDMDGNDLKHVLIKRTRPGDCNSNVTNGSPFVPSGRMQDNGQAICVAVFPIQALAAPGTTIGSIILWSADKDHPDGKVILVHELATPDVCYDYSVRQNGHTLPSKDKKFSAVTHGDVSIALGLKSMEADFDMTKAKLRLDTNLTFKKAEYSPDQVNTYLDATYIFGSVIPEIALGSDVTTDGGTIGMLERYFGKFTYAPPTHGNALEFNFDLNITYDISDTQNNPKTYLLTSDPRKYNAKDTVFKELRRCPISERYTPQWGQFNIERTDSGSVHPITDANANLRFPLYTQISGKDFDFSIVSYDSNATPAYMKELPISGTTVEVELIDVSSYNDAETFFRCNDPNHDIVTDIGNESSIFVHFNKVGGQDMSRVDITGEGDLKTQNAIRNAAFRMWVLYDQNSTLVPHNCSKNDNACFQKVYDDFLVSSDTLNACGSCASYGGGGSDACYSCLKDYFAKPTCSRDNFSIRPASYSMSISDTDESDDPVSQSNYLQNNASTNSNSAALAAGYMYKVDANATLFGTSTPAKGYHRDFKDTPSRMLVSKLIFKNSGTNCADTNDSTLETRFFNGKISGNFNDPTNFTSNNLHANGNVGNYDYHIEDLNWTIVDQDGYFTKDGKALKTFSGVNDCLGLDDSNIPRYGEAELYRISDTDNQKHGCGISSILNSEGYKDITLSFYPYSFSFDNLNFIVPTSDNFIYTNNLNSTTLTNLYMSASFRGDVVAAAKGGTRTSNFTDGCYASDVVFDINQSYSRNNNPLDKNSITAEDLDAGTDKNVYFQRQYLNTALHPNYQTENNENNLSVTIVKSEFLDENNGSAQLRLFYNFEKDDTHIMNPVNVSFNRHEASAPNERFNAHMRDDYITTGIADINQTINFYYGRIVSGQSIYQVPSDKTSVVIPLYVEAYCDASVVTCTLHGLGLQSERSAGTWWINGEHDSPRGDGLIASFNNTSDITTSPGTPINLNADVNKTDVNFTAASSLVRPTRREVAVVPDVPWFNQATFILDFLGGGGWGGKGNTGLVVDTNASESSINKRMEW
jgi:hypothetical protein